MTRKSTSDCPQHWAGIARAVKQAAGYTLTVHHLDLNPAHCVWWNMPVLCQGCYLRVQNKAVMQRRWMFEHAVWFKPYAAGVYARLSGRPQDCASVLAHLEAWLALEKVWTPDAEGA